MKISKEYFKRNLDALAKSYEVTDELEQFLKLFFGYTPTVTFMDDLRSAYEKLLKNVCECEDAPDIFSWWILSSDKKEILEEDMYTGESVIYDVETIDGLWNYLNEVFPRRTENTI